MVDVVIVRHGVRNQLADVVLVVLAALGRMEVQHFVAVSQEEVARNVTRHLDPFEIPGLQKLEERSFEIHSIER